MKQLQTLLVSILLTIACLPFPSTAVGEDLKVGAASPLFTLKNQEGAEFSLADRKGKGWTVLFFYPKAGTPGCTKQACAFRDSIDKIRALNAEVLGISADTVEAQKGFHTEHALKFDLLADHEMEVIKKFGAKLPVLSMAKRWTFILDPELRIQSFEPNVDPMLDAARVESTLKELQTAARSPAP